MTDRPGDDAPAAAVVGRTLGGVVLLLVGVALTLAGALWYFVVGPFGWVLGGVWETLSDLDLVGALVLGIGIVLLAVGGTLVRRARRRSSGIRFSVGGPGPG